MAGEMRISMVVELNAQRGRAEAAALRAEIDALGKSARASGQSTAAAAPGIAAIGTASSSTAADVARATETGAAWAAQVAATRLAINPLAAALQQAQQGIRDVAVAEDIGALTSREAALAHDQLARSVDMITGQLARYASAADLAVAANARVESSVQQLIASNTGMAGSTGESIAAQLQHGMALDELRARFDPLFAASRRYEMELRDIADAERQGALSATAAAAARDRAAQTMAPQIRQIGMAAQNAGGYVTQLGYQANDVMVMMAAGQNPMVLAMQQGTQVSQVFQQMKKDGTALGPAIRGSLLSMVSPMSLVTMGAIALGAFLVQSLMSMQGETKTADEAVQDLTGSVQKFASETRRSTADVVRDFGAINPELAEMQRNLTALSQVKALQDVQATMKSLKAEVTGQWFKSGVDNSAELLGTPALKAGRAGSTSSGPINEFMANLNELQSAKGPQAQLAVVRDLSEQLVTAAGGIDSMSVAQSTYYGLLLDSEQSLGRLVAAQAEARRQAVELAIAGGAQNIGMHAAMSVDQPKTVDPEQRARGRESAAELIAAGREENELARLKLVYGEQSAEVRAEENRQAMAAVEAKIRELHLADQSLQAQQMRRNELVHQAAVEGSIIQARERAATELQTQYSTEAQIVALTAKYGADSLEVAYARAAAEREAQVALLESQGYAAAQADELMRGWDAARGIASINMAAGISEAADVAALLAARLGVSMQNALGLMGIAAGTKNAKAGSGLSFAIGSPEAAAASKPVLGFGDTSGSSYQAPSYDKPKAAGGGKGAETNGVLALIAAQQRELAILREIDPVKQEMLRNSDALAKASVKERAALETLIRTRVAEEAALEKVRSAQNELGETGRSLFIGLAEGTMTWVDALDTVLSKLAEMAASSVWDMIWNGQGGSGGLGAMVTGWLGDSMLAKAGGGYISGPGGPRDDAIPAWLSNGEYVVNAAATSKALPLLQAINAGVPVDRLVAAIGGRPAFASGGYVGVGSAAPAWARADDSNRASPAASNRPLVEINHYGSDQIEAKETTGPNGEEIIAITVGKQLSRGRFDKQQKARYGVEPTVARR